MVVLGDDPPRLLLPAARFLPEGDSSVAAASVTTAVLSFPVQSKTRTAPGDWFWKQATPAGDGHTLGEQVAPPIDALRTAVVASATCHAFGYGTCSNVQAAQTASTSSPPCQPIGHSIVVTFPAVAVA